MCAIKTYQGSEILYTLETGYGAIDAFYTGYITNLLRGEIVKTIGIKSFFDILPEIVIEEVYVIYKQIAGFIDLRGGAVKFSVVYRVGGDLRIRTLLKDDFDSELFGGGHDGQLIKGGRIAVTKGGINVCTGKEQEAAVFLRGELIILGVINEDVSLRRGADKANGNSRRGLRFGIGRGHGLVVCRGGNYQQNLSRRLRRGLRVLLGRGLRFGGQLVRERGHAPIEGSFLLGKGRGGQQPNAQRDRQHDGEEIFKQ